MTATVEIVGGGAQIVRIRLDLFGHGLDVLGRAVGRADRHLTQGVDGLLRGFQICERGLIGAIQIERVGLLLHGGQRVLMHLERAAALRSHTDRASSALPPPWFIIRNAAIAAITTTTTTMAPTISGVLDFAPFDCVDSAEVFCSSLMEITPVLRN